MDDVNLEIKLNNIDERVIKIEESGAGEVVGGVVYQITRCFIAEQIHHHLVEILHWLNQ